MVRRKLLSCSAKQAYQNLWQQQQPRLQSPLMAPMPQYWLGGAVPVSCVRRQPSKEPRATATNYVQQQQHQQLPLQTQYQTMWNRCCGHRGTLLKPGAILPGFPHLAYPGVPGRAVTPQPLSQRPFQYQQGHLFNYPAAVKMHQMQQKHPAPVSILKKASQVECPGFHNTKRVTIKSPPRYQLPSVEQVKPRPEVPPKPFRKARQLEPRRDQQKLLQQQLLYQKQLQRQKQLQEQLQRQQEQQLELQQQQQLQRELQKQHLQQHQLKQQKLREFREEERKAQEHLQRSRSFNFGKFASSFLESATSMSQRPQSPNKNHNFFYQETKKDPSKQQEKPEVPGKTVESIKEENNYFQENYDLENGSSTTTLTTEQSHGDCKPPYRSGTSLVDKATNTQIDPLGELLKEVPHKASKGSRKININELLRSEQVKGLSADPMWHSLMQLVTDMCESKEQENQADPETQSRLRAGFGTEKARQKQYSVYLMVSSDEDDDHKSEGDSTRIVSNESIQENLCDNVYQEEYPRLGRRKRTRKRLSPRMDDLPYLLSSSLPFIPTRRPLHWPKLDYSKLSQGRTNRSRTSSRVRSRSSSKQVIPIVSQRSVSSTLDPNRSWRLWQDLPMTAKSLNKAYSRMWMLSGGRSCTKF